MESGQIQGASKMSALGALEEVIKISEQKTKRLKSLKAYLEGMAMPQEVDEVIWSMLNQVRGSYYI